MPNLWKNGGVRKLLGAAAILVVGVVAGADGSLAQAVAPPVVTIDPTNPDFDECDDFDVDPGINYQPGGSATKPFDGECFLVGALPLSAAVLGITLENDVPELPSVAGAQLPRTGNDASDQLLVAGGLVGMGGVLIAATLARRRRAQ